ncbi:hypothetical protein A3J90_02570 [candidate division WOR-1 bacterium RIFOXYC2_FULL_37_10]|uniref:Uncharacterized protein n=1 Tax=candidate division WOR-1 bacterium RIFOXYB2_FULL_37_13 TaxID=1802579 RepID=A0A1F4SEE2_UNCSA|nr:MAG: hypothetical protein A2246_03530 [candidate division WOR-1 bacterium RIFOXYA2_FULL_37_7]OGC18786.1 MAG: hypothetical protein A2310_00580 [candidate division WOR-1 bacterium RIFOXYB2_FULL_37_13]OGC33987.1 MAG: hypothetical protein A3J90_02570 [candidate division WOR-1 bacterium RIFOXYC2_FULL_37_10]
MKSIAINDLGEKYLTEQCQKIKVSEFIAKLKNQLKSVIFNSEIKLLGFSIKVVNTEPNYGGKRMWFECPLCGRRKGVLYKHPIKEKIGCRQCLNLEYNKRRYKGMLESEIFRERIN